MVSSNNARCAAILLLAALVLSCSGMVSAARNLEETAPSAPEDDYPAEAPPVPEDDYPAEAPETREQEQPPPFPEFAMPPFPTVGLPSMPEMPSIPGFHFAEPQPEADEP